MRVLGVIPARGGSKGIPRKNIKSLGGKPLLAYTLESARKANLLSKVIVSTDDEEISSYAQKSGVEVPFIRPERISQDDTPSIEVLTHAYKFFAEKGINFDAVCLLQPTTPFREEDLIDRAIKIFQKGDYESLVSVRQVPHQFNPHWCFEEKGGKLSIATGEEKIISRRQELPRAFHRDGAIYLTKTNTLINQRSMYGKSVGYVDRSLSRYVNLDNLADWAEAEKIVQEKKDD